MITFDQPRFGGIHSSERINRHSEKIHKISPKLVAIIGNLLTVDEESRPHLKDIENQLDAIQNNIFFIQFSVSELIKIKKIVIYI